MYSNNRYKVLEFSVEPTDYEDYEDISPYNKLKNGNWKTLFFNKHPVCYMLKNRIRNDEKLLWIELNNIKENIKKKKDDLANYLNRVSNRLNELNRTIATNKKLCEEGDLQEHMEKLDTILFCSLSTDKTNKEEFLTSILSKIDDSVMIMDYTMSFIEPKETCAEKLQKKLKQCNGLYGKYMCDHYYEIERAKDELSEFIYYEIEEEEEISKLEYVYSRALAIKKNMLQDFEDDFEDDVY